MKNKAGFTLIEVLIALAILSIALTAIIQSTSQNIKDTLYLQNKTIAIWVGTELIAEVEAGILKVPAAPDKLTREVEMLDQKWRCVAHLTPTPNKKIQSMDVAVYPATSKTKLIHLVSYLYVA